MSSAQRIEAAAALVHGAIGSSPQISWPLLSQRIGAETWVKHENHLPTGAFKVRGGLTYIDRLRRDQPNLRGVIAATRGNHVQSIAFAARPEAPLDHVVHRGERDVPQDVRRGAIKRVLERGRE